jgi:aldehyde:ferredoxin oxidoreductase
MSYAGTILRVDLTDRKIEREPTSSYVRDYVGGLSIGTKLFWDAVPPEVPALDPRNMLIFSTGPLTGTLLGNKCAVITKSPLYTNQIIGNTGMGGHFPSEMKFAGYDHIVITGRSETPVYLLVNDDEVEIRNAKNLWGMDVYETQASLKDELKDPEAQVACIGPAGENMVAYALILHDIDSTASKGGHGAVMGSKRLKAVAVRGTKGLRIADPKTFMALWRRYWEYYTEGRGRYGLRLIHDRGIAGQGDACVKQDVAAWGYFDSYVVPPPKKEEQLANFLDKHMVGSIGCAFCPAQCHQNCDAAGIGGAVVCWAYAGFRWIVKNKDQNLWWRCHQLCQRYGLEINEAAGITAWLMKLYEVGIITAADTDGIPMEWGSEGACIATIEKMARREGFGELLADGTVPAAKRIGRDSLKHAVQVTNKQVYPATGMPIGGSAGIYMIPAASEVWTHPPSADKDYVYPFMAPALGVSDEEAERITDEWTSEHAEKTTGYRDSWEEFNYEHYADYAVVNEAAISACDISGHCDWLSDRMPHYGFRWGPEDNAQAISAASGIKCTTEMILDAHRRRRLLELAHIRLCYRAFGEKMELPLKLLMPKPDGRSKGSSLDLAKIPQVSQRYCELMGIDPETQLPKRAELERLGLKDVADMLDGLDSKEKAVRPG